MLAVPRLQVPFSFAATSDCALAFPSACGSALGSNWSQIFLLGFFFGFAVCVFAYNHYLAELLAKKRLSTGLLFEKFG